MDIIRYFVYNRGLLKRYKPEDITLGIWMTPLDVEYVDIKENTTFYPKEKCTEEIIIAHKSYNKNPVELYENHQRHLSR